MSGVIVNPSLFGVAAGTTLDLVDDFAGSYFDFLNDFYDTTDDFVTLMVPGPGTYDLDGAPSGQEWIPHNEGYNSSGFLIKGYGSPNPIIWQGAIAPKLTSEPPFRPYTGAPVQTYNPKFETVSAGSYTVTIIDPLTNLYLNPPNPHVSYFQVGRWALLYCWDMMGYGYPQNNYYFEYKQIADVDYTTGVITFTEPLTQNYSATYPQVDVGNPEQDPGGPATIMPMGEDFGGSFTWENIGFDLNPPQFYGSANNVLMKNCQFPNSPTTPTFSNTFSHQGCSFTGSNFEIDKLVTNLNFIDCEIDSVSVNFQSASIENVLFENCTFANSSSISGCGKNITVTNCTGDGTSLIRFGTAFGPQLSATISDSYFATLDNNNYGFSAELIFDNGSFEPDGTIIIDRTVAKSTDILLTLTPGDGYYCFAHGSRNFAWFKVLDCVETGGNFVYTTNLADVLTVDFAAQIAALQALGVGITKHACPDCTVTNSTSDNDVLDVLSRAPAHTPYLSYFHSGTLGGGGPVYNPHAFGVMSGTLVTLKVNVIVPYTGVRSSLFIRPFNPFFGTGTWSNPVTYAVGDYAPMINVKTAGLRTITPSGVTGTQTGDHELNTGLPSLALPAGLTYFTSNAGSSLAQPPSTDFVYLDGESTSVHPTFTVEIILDQGIA